MSTCTAAGVIAFNNTLLLDAVQTFVSLCNRCGEASPERPAAAAAAGVPHAMHERTLTALAACVCRICSITAQAYSQGSAAVHWMPHTSAMLRSYAALMKHFASSNITLPGALFGLLLPAAVLCPAKYVILPAHKAMPCICCMCDGV